MNIVIGEHSMASNNLESLIKILREQSNKYGYSSKILSFNDTEAYQSIIAIGKEALPTLLAELKESPDFWLLYILKDITGVDIVNDQNRGKIYQMAQAWVDWGKSQNIAPNDFIE